MTSDLHQLPVTIDDVYEHTLAALTDEPWRPNEVVAWLSAHLAAVEHVLYPAAHRAGVDAAFLRRQREATHRLLLALRTLEHVAARGPVPRALSLPRFRDELVETIGSHAADERELLIRLRDRLPDADVMSVQERYADALRRGPTRPHPWAPHRGVWERFTFTFDRLRDHVLDVLDARVVPMPRPRREAPKNATKWGHYLLGQPLDSPSSLDFRP